MKFDEPTDEEDVVEMVTTNQTDIHLQISQIPSIDECDFAPNPYGGRENTNSSLFFEDEERSVDYVLVWKKILPPDDCNETDSLEMKEIEDMKRKETSRAEKREVFEESLINEGLQLESYVVDDEITFVKIHAPLEVLRRYAEILKLRLPMKEVRSYKRFTVGSNHF